MEKSSSPQTRFNFRSFVTAGMTLTVFILPVSGIMNHQLQFSPMTSERHFGMAMHNLTGLLFIGFLLVHMGLNRRVLWNYFSTKRRNLVNRELLAAIAIVTVSVIGVALHAFHVR